MATCTNKHNMPSVTHAAYAAIYLACNYTGINVEWENDSIVVISHDATTFEQVRIVMGQIHRMTWDDVAARMNLIEQVVGKELGPGNFIKEPG